MGCFSTCFGNCKRSHRRCGRDGKTSPSLLDHLQTTQSVEFLEVPQLIEEQEEKEKENGGENQIEVTPDLNNGMKPEKSNSSERKKVTFDLNVKIYEDLPREDDIEDMDGSIVERICEEVEGEKAHNKERKCSFGSVCNSDSSSSSLFSFPPNHRYQNCRDSDDELSSDESDVDDYTDDDYDDHDDDGDGDDDEEVESEVVKTDAYVKGQEQSSKSLFSLSLESKRQDCGDKEVHSPMPLKRSSANDDINMDEFNRNSSKHVDSVLNPVENLSQWKFVKTRSKQASKDHQAKENIIAGQDFSFPVKRGPVLGKEIGVDTSLSSWLVGSGGTPKNNSRSSSVSVGNSPSDMNKCSPNKFEDRPIEELRQFSASNSPRKSPSKSPEDMPIIGSVGSYWSAQTADSASSARSTKSKYRESAEVIWDSTPFETRLEKALEKEAKAGQILAV